MARPFSGSRKSRQIWERGHFCEFSSGICYSIDYHFPASPDPPAPARPVDLIGVISRNRGKLSRRPLEINWAGENQVRNLSISMPIELKIPQVGESITEVEIGPWLKQPGELVQKDEPVVTLESEKATVELPA